MPQLDLGLVIGPQGPQGPEGPAGPQGPQGPQGEQAKVVNDLTTGGVDAALSAEQGKVLGAALSNKATNLGYVSSPYETVLDVVLSCTTDSSFFVGNDGSPLFYAADAPWGQSETQYFVLVDGVKARRIVFAVLYGSNVQPQIAIRPVFGNEWLLDWTYIPITTPPQKYSLPLADGLSQVSTSWYSKDQFDQVHVHGAISAGSGSFSRDMIVATLPEGYRPATRIECPATFLDTSTSVAIAGAVAVNPDGTIWSFPDIPTAQDLAYFDLFF